MSAPTRQRVVVVSDLHMAVPDGPIGAPAACYVFGHTHVAEDRPLADRGGAPQYVNAVTWSTMVRPGRDGAEDRLRFIVIAHGVRRPATAQLKRWQRT